MMTESSTTKMLRIRPIQAADLQPLKSFLHELSPGTLYFRFGRLSMPMWTEQEWRALCEPDPRRSSHFIATQITRPGHYRVVGMGRLVFSANTTDAEFSIVLSDECQRQGLGTKLMHAMVGEARRWGLTSIYGDVLPSNGPMLSFCEGLGLVRRTCPEDPRIHRMVLQIKPTDAGRGYAGQPPSKGYQPLRQAG